MGTKEVQEECPACGGEMRHSFLLDWWRCGECAFTLTDEVMSAMRTSEYIGFISPPEAKVIVEVTVEKELVA